MKQRIIGLVISFFLIASLFTGAVLADEAETSPTAEPTVAAAETESLPAEEPTEYAGPVTEPTQAPAVTSGKFGEGNLFTWEVSAGVLTVSGSGFMGPWGSQTPPWYPLRDQIIHVVFSGPIGTIYTGAFQGCTALSSITWSTGLSIIYPYGFSGCSGLSALSLPQGLRELSAGAFSGCTDLSSVTFPESLITIGPGCFSGCGSLSSVSIPAGVVNIQSDAFAGCALSSVTVPHTVTVLSDGVFRGCGNLTAVSLQGPVTAVGAGAFSGCASLGSITFPAGLERIGDSAFSSCPGLHSVYCMGSMPELGEGIFAGSPNAVLYYDPANPSWTPEKIALAAEKGVTVLPIGGISTDPSDAPTEASTAPSQPVPIIISPSPGTIPTQTMQTEEAAALPSTEAPAAYSEIPLESAAPQVPDSSGGTGQELLLWLIFLALMLVFCALVFLIGELRAKRRKNSA